MGFELKLNLDFDALPEHSNVGYLAVLTAKLLLKNFELFRPSASYSGLSFSSEMLAALKLMHITELPKNQEQVELFANYGAAESTQESGSDVFNQDELDDKEVYALYFQVKELAEEIISKYDNHFKLESHIYKNIQIVADFFDYPKGSTELMQFLCSTALDRNFKEFGSDIPIEKKTEAKQILKKVFNLKSSETTELLSLQSKFVKTGVFEPLSYISGGFGGYQINGDFVDSMIDEDFDFQAYLKKYFSPGTPPLNKVEDFEYIKETEIIREHLNSQSNYPLNILVYGSPGTGKTEWVKSLVESLGADLILIPEKDEEGEELGASKRLSAFSTTQMILSKNNKDTDQLKAHDKPRIILFDEIGDVFPTNDPFMAMLIGQRSGSSKAFINSVLEEKHVTSFWITNDVEHFDEAYLRRFDLKIEVNTPPKLQREKIYSQILGDLSFSKKWLSGLSDYSLSPALLKQAACFVKEKGGISPKKTEGLLLELINQTMKVQNKPLLKINSNQISDYSLGYVNTDIDLTLSMERLANKKFGRLLLYGLPGTGKTAFGKYLSETAGLTLIQKTASDLMSKYVGETEKLISKAFNEAKNSEAILQIDEIDSFLFDRNSASSTWQISQVNQFLQELENFDGIFIGTSNLLELMDSAVFRRFDLKANFKALNSNQVLELFKSYFENLELDEVFCQKVKLLSPLTPGDFVSAKRQVDFTCESLQPESLYLALNDQLKYKPEKMHNKPIGFTAEVGS